MDKVGIVLAGGGGKGAYEVGVWKSLQSVIADLGLEIGAFSGTSVGALNAALFACDSIEEAEAIWGTVDPLTILTPDVMKALTIFLKLGLIDQLCKEIDQNGLFSRDGLIRLIEKAQIKQRIQECGKEVYATCLNIDEKKAEYFRLDSTNYEKYLLASSAIPFIFPQEKITDKEEKKNYWDGGFSKQGDNLPYSPLLQKGYKRFIVIHLDDKEWYPVEDTSGCKMYHVFPTKSLNGKWGTIDFTPNGIRRKKDYGKFDVLQDYEYRELIKNVLMDQSNDELHLANGKIYHSLNELHKNRAVQIYNAEELAQALNNKTAQIVVVDYEISDTMIKFGKIDAKQLSLIIAAVGAFMALQIGMPAIGTPVALAVLAPAIAILGKNTVIALVKLVLKAGTTDVLKDIELYDVQKQDNGSVILCLNDNEEKQVFLKDMEEYLK